MESVKSIQSMFALKATRGRIRMAIKALLCTVILLNPTFGATQNSDPLENFTGQSACKQPPDALRSQKATWFQERKSNIVFVFVHGIFSNNKDGWLAENCTYFPKLVADAFPEASVYLGGFYTSIFAEDYDAVDAASLLFDRMTGISEGADPAALRVLDRSQIVFVAHSTGGLVVRHMLASNASAFRDKRIGLVLLASPTKGSFWADLGKPVAKLGANKLAQQLASESEFLRSLNDSFQRFINDRQRAQNTFGIEIIETKFIAPYLWGFNWRVVDRASGAVYFLPPKVKANANHFEVAKPKDLGDDTFLWLRDLYVNDFQARSKKFEYPAGKVATIGAQYRVMETTLVEEQVKGEIIQLPDSSICSPRDDEMLQWSCVISRSIETSPTGRKVVDSSALGVLEPGSKPAFSAISASRPSANTVQLLVDLGLREVTHRVNVRFDIRVKSIANENWSLRKIEEQPVGLGEIVQLKFPYGADQSKLRGNVLGSSVELPVGASSADGWMKFCGYKRGSDSYIAAWRILRPYLRDDSCEGFSADGLN